MTMKSIVGAPTKCSAKTSLAGALILTAAVALLLAPASALAAGGEPYKPSDAVSFEEIPGSSVKRVILKQKAAERLGIEVGEVSEQVIVRKQMVGGVIVRPVEQNQIPQANIGGFGGFGQTQATVMQEAATSTEMPESGDVWVRVTLSKGEWDRMRKEDAARILPLHTRSAFKNEVFALPSSLDPVEDLKRTMLKAYYIIPEGDHDLALFERVRVELQLEGTGKKRMVVPYSAVYYDGKGDPWVYVVTRPLVYERQHIEIERIEGEFAVITGGPPVGTSVVTVGAALLYGAEVIYKR